MDHNEEVLNAWSLLEAHWRIPTNEAPLAPTPNYSIIRWLISPILRPIVNTKLNGMHHIPRKGAVILAANHLSHVDPIMVIASVRRSVRYLAKSFSADSEVRFNSGPLKTSSSAGIPGYLVNYLYAEKLTYRKRALKTKEVADLATYLLSPRSSGINGQGIVIDAGMGFNYFDGEIVDSATKIEK